MEVVHREIGERTVPSGESENSFNYSNYPVSQREARVPMGKSLVPSRELAVPHRIAVS